MDVPKFLMGDNTQFGDSLYIIHTQSPAFIMDVDSEDIKFLDDSIADENDQDAANEIADLVEEALAFYDKEIEAYESIED